MGLVNLLSRGMVLFPLIVSNALSQEPVSPLESISLESEKYQHFLDEERHALDYYRDLTGEIDGQILYAQEVLEREGYFIGALDGVWGWRTKKALITFQKMQGLKLTGVIDPETTSAFENPRRSEPKHKREGVYVEIDLSNQLLYLVRDAEIQNIFHVSTGRAGYRTPRGNFNIYDLERRGWRKAFNKKGEFWGQVYNPIKFHKSCYIHGSPYVPYHPDSHGCVRVEPYHADFLHKRLKVGTPVIIY